MLRTHHPSPASSRLAPPKDSRLPSGIPCPRVAQTFPPVFRRPVIPPLALLTPPSRYPLFLAAFLLGLFLVPSFLRAQTTDLALVKQRILATARYTLLRTRPETLVLVESLAC